MAQTLSNLLIHIVFSTKHRTEWIHDDLKNELYPYIGGIVREMRGRSLAIGGMKDHLHLLLRVPPSLSISETVRVIKANSSRWIHEKWRSHATIAWQEGYGAFSVSASVAESVTQYILNQPKHHAKRSFQEELIEFLRQNKVQYDEKFLWD